MDFILMSFRIAGWISTFIGIIGIFIILKALRRFSGDLKKALLFMLFSLISFLVIGISIGILTLKYHIPYIYGLVIVPLFFIGIFFMVFGGKKLLDVLNKIDSKRRR